MRLTIVFLLFLALTGMAIAQPKVGGIVNGASFVPGQAIAPGSLFSIFGTSLAAAPAAADSIPLSTSLGGVTVKFVSGGTTAEAPLLFLQSNQINAAVPWNLVPGTATVTVTSGGVSSAPASVTIGDFSPAIFPIGTMAAVQNVDGSLAQPAGSISGRTTHPAAIGDVVIIYATGLGPVVTTPAEGGVPSQTTDTLHKPFVAIGGIGADIQFSGLSPQFVGVYQLNVVVPNVAPGDTVPIQLTLGGITSPKLTMAVSQ
ncbi:MAG: hypothetical protein ABSE86_36095 [Bryobacteraceae bacterium]|jgi:uncharacterized protein (TIGR03437 family)